MKSFYFAMASLVVVGGLAFAFAGSVVERNLAKNQCGCPECCVESGCCSGASCCCDTGDCKCQTCDCSCCTEQQADASEAQSCQSGSACCTQG